MKRGRQLPSSFLFDIYFNMFAVATKLSFSAAHNLPNYNGKCENLHGHNWDVEVQVSSEKLENGMVIDFKILKKYLKEILSTLDHTYINEKIENPTAENIAKYIYENLREKLPPKFNIDYIKVWETRNNVAIYMP